MYTSALKIFRLNILDICLLLKQTNSFEVFPSSLMLNIQFKNLQIFRTKSKTEPVESESSKIKIFCELIQIICLRLLETLVSTICEVWLR